MIKKIAAVIVLITIPFSTAAQDNYLKLNLLRTHPFIISQNIGLSLSRTDYNSIGTGFSFNFGGEYFIKQIDSHFFGLKASLDVLKVNGNDEFKIPKMFSTSITNFSFGPVYSFEFDTSWYPFASLGFVISWFDPRKSDGTKLPRNQMNDYNNLTLDYYLEAGIKYRLTREWLLFIAGKLFINDDDLIDDDDRYVFADFYGTINIGLSYAISFLDDSDEDGVIDVWDKCPFTPLGLEVTEYGCPIDEDIDGVPDYRDECPDTPLGVHVDQHGCPLDDDNDGVPNYMDACPGTPVKVSVDENGCPVDSDGDGVPDYIDLCPDTEAGAIVDSLGCPRIDESKEFIESTIIYFDSGNAELSEEAIHQLEKLKHIIRNYENIVWFIEGHKDNLEKSALIEEEISSTRVKSVLDYFLRQGISPIRFKFIDRGDKFAVGDNKTMTGRALNRRVVIFGIK